MARNQSGSGSSSEQKAGQSETKTSTKGTVIKLKPEQIRHTYVPIFVRPIKALKSVRQDKIFISAPSQQQFKRKLRQISEYGHI
jgi:hypothetical protein